jgi:hypothetical protein
MSDDARNLPNDPLIQPGDLESFVRGEAGPDIEALIRSSPELLAEAEQLKEVHEALLDYFSQDQGPTSDELADYLLDKLPPPKRLRIAAYLRQNPQAREELDSMWRILQPSDSMLDQVRERAAVALAAVLAVTARGHEVAALRGEARQRLYEADEFQISLRVLSEPASELHALSGHVRRIGDQAAAVADDDLSGEAWLFQSPESTLVKTTVAANGLFLFEAMPAGQYGLLLELRPCSLSLDEIVL